MILSNRNTIIQALANIRLEGLEVSNDIKEILERAMNGEIVTTDEIFKILRNSDES